MVRFSTIITFFSVFLLTSCSVTKHLPPDESLYKGAEVKVIADSLITKQQASHIKEELTSIIRPLPNNTLFGFPYRVWFYYLFGEKNTGIGGFIRKRFGEATILANKRLVSSNADILSNYLNNEGYFRSTTNGNLIIKKREATAIYTVNVKPRYFIGEVTFTDKDTSVFGRNLALTQATTHLKTHEPYRLQTLKDERERIDNALKKKGFYLFQPDYIIISADSSVGNRRVNLSVEIKPTTSQITKKPYFIRNIFVHLDDKRTDSIQINRNFYLLNSTNNFRKRLFLSSISFRSGNLYNSDLQEVSLSRLINLNNFKFVRNRFDLVSRSDSALLNLHYFLTPLKTKAFSAEIGGESKSNNLAGMKFNLTWRNKNLFKGGEQFSISANIVYDWQVGGGNDAQYNAGYRWNINQNLAIPRFLVPFVRINSTKSQVLPKTNIGFGYEKFIRKNLYDQTFIKATMGYAWRHGTSTEHILNPVSIIITKINPTTNIVDYILNSPNPAQSLILLNDRFILGATYDFYYTPPVKGKHQIYFKGGIDVAGNLAGLLTKKTNGEHLVFENTIEQYTRFDADFRYYLNSSDKGNLQWANRFMIGLGIPYGNSIALPDFKQFFSGGTNSIRAFGARSFGPGSYKSTAATNYFPNSGDIKIELNTELRAKFTQYINGAVFIDAGNVWMYKAPSYYDDRAIFTKTFMKELAVGTGAGLRFDFTYLVFRLDLAFPIRKPWLEENKRWVFKEIDLGSKTWRKENLLLNIAIGYPF